MLPKKQRASGNVSVEIMTTLEEDEGEVIFEDKNVKFKEPTPKN